jgi:hypothetical protein
MADQPNGGSSIEKPIPGFKPAPTTFDEVGKDLAALRHAVNNLRTVLSSHSDVIDEVMERLKKLEEASKNLPPL